MGTGAQFAQAWTDPSAAPPGGTVVGPITTSPDAQTKAGAFTSGISVTAPMFCLGTSCITAWPTSGCTPNWTPDPSGTCTTNTLTQTDGCTPVHSRTVNGTRNCSCTDTTWTPDPSGTCTTSTLTQTSNCGNTRTVSGTKSCPAPLTLTSAIDGYYTGANKMVFPVRNGAGRYNNSPPTAAICYGSWWIDTRGTNFDSKCTTGWVWSANCNAPNGTGVIPGCPAQPPTTRTSYSCVSDYCQGWNTTVAVGNTTHPVMGGIVCAGQWWIDTRDPSYTSWCATGWDTSGMHSGY